MLDIRLAFRRIKYTLELNLIILIGMGISVLVVSSFPVYLDSLDRQSFRSELAQYVDNHSEAALNTNVTYPFLALNIQDIEKSDNFVRDSFKSAFQISNVDMQRQIRTGLFEFNIPREPSTSLSDGMIRPMTQGYFLNISKIDEHVTYIKGNALTKPEDGSYIPVAVESRVAQEFGFQMERCLQPTLRLVLVFKHMRHNQDGYLTQIEMMTGKLSRLLVFSNRSILVMNFGGETLMIT